MADDDRAKLWAGRIPSKDEITAMEMLLDADWSEVNCYFVHVPPTGPSLLTLFNPDGTVLYKENMIA